MIGAASRHHRRARPPHLGRATPVGCNGLSQHLAQAGMGQDEIVIHLEQGQLLAQPVFALTRCRAAPPDRRYSLAQTQIEPLHKRRVDLPAMGGQDVIDRLQGAEDHAGVPWTRRWRRMVLITCA